MSSLGKSPRTDRDKELINWDKDWAQIKTVFCTETTDGEIEIKLSKAEKKRVAVNGLPLIKIGELLGWLNVIYFSPEEINMIIAYRNLPASSREMILRMLNIE